MDISAGSSSRLAIFAFRRAIAVAPVDRDDVLPQSMTAQLSEVDNASCR